LQVYSLKMVKAIYMILGSRGFISIRTWNTEYTKIRAVLVEFWQQSKLFSWSIYYLEPKCLSII